MFFSNFILYLYFQKIPFCVRRAVIVPRGFDTSLTVYWDSFDMFSYPGPLVTGFILTHIAYIDNGYWLINHWTDWARTSVTSFGRKFDFHDVLYHIWHCNVDNRRRNIVLTTIVRKNTRFSLNKSCRKFWQFVQDGRIVIDWRIRSY